MKTPILFLFIFSQATAFSSPIPDDERVSLLLEGKKEIRSLNEMRKLGLNSGSTEIDLWSGSYWPHYQGSVALRYRDPSFIRLIEGKNQFEDFKKLFELKPLYSMQDKENDLSPAEKYDLLVGDSDMSLTKYAWEIGDKAAMGGKVKTWRGLCDGWASAAQKMPRPKKSITLNSPSGTPITFYPEDIKALGSLMYARSQGPVIFLGKRCRNQALGLFTGACKEINPGALHRALVNRVGSLKKSFIADVSPGGEVWNYPVESYKITFYNVFTEEESDNHEEVKELFSKKQGFSKKNSRHESTHSIVGVKLNVNFKDMRAANLLEIDDISSDKLLQMEYTYDLELDRNNNVLGGESFGDKLPDFIWAPNDKTYPLSAAEKMNPRKTTLELSKAAAKKGQPLSRVIEKLFTLSEVN